MTDLLDQLIVETPAKRWLRMYLDHQEREFCLIWPFTRAQNGYPIAGGDGAVRPTRIMCEHWNGPPPSEEHQAAHSCDNGHLGCINPWHLSWKTPSENQKDRKNSVGIRKLTPAEVDEIRSMKSRERTVDTAARFNVTEANIRQIQAGKTWRLESKRRAFSDAEVTRIRSAPFGVVGTVSALAEEFGVSRACIYRIRNRQSFVHVPEAGPQLRQQGE